MTAQGCQDGGISRNCESAQDLFWGVKRLEMVVQLCEYADKWKSLECMFWSGHIVYFVKYSPGALPPKDIDHPKPQHADTPLDNLPTFASNLPHYV